MAITMRRGNPEDFDPTKMLPGEFAVTTGPDRKARKLYICFAPGIVKQLGTYEDFEDMISDATVEVKEQYITAFNDILAQIEQDKNTAADEYAYIVSFKDSLEKTYIPEIANSIAAAANSATAANTAQEAAATYKDNAKTYMDNAAAYSKEAKAAASSITGALKPKGTVNFEELPDLADADSGDMYNVANEFVSTADYKDGGGITYPSGTNVYKTEDGMWDCLGGQLSDYLMRDDIDAAVEESMPDYTSNSYMENLVAGEKLSKALGKIKIAVKNVIALVKLLGTTDISKIADGSVTGALNAHDNSINSLNSSLATYNPDDITRIALLTDKSKLGERLQLSESMWHFKYISFKINQGYTRAIIIPSSWLKYYMAHSWWMPIEWRFRESYLMCINIISSTTDGTTIDFLENQVEVLGWSFTNMEIFGINKLL